MILMKILTTTFILILLILQGYADSLEFGRTNNFNPDWKFHLGESPGFIAPKFDDHLWRTLELPHDWSIEGEFDQSNPVKNIKRRTVMDSKVGFWQ